VEQSFLAYLRGRTRGLPAVPVGIGDDAAVLSNPPPGSRMVACTDQIVDGVDFRFGQQADSDIGYKSMAINLSDIAAMGAVPTSALVTLSLPEEDATETAGAVYEGIFEAAEQFQVAIAGGDLTIYDGPLAISVTIFGTVETPWLRSGAGVGDALFVTGLLGGSLLGRHLRPHPRIELAAWLRRHVNVTAAIDISDGFSLDLDRLCAASRVGVELDLQRLPVSPDAAVRAEKTGRSAQQHAWSDGEDFELIFTCGSDDADRLEALAREREMAGNGPGDRVALTRLGTIVSRTGLWKTLAEGKFERVFPQGYVHGELPAESIRDADLRRESQS